MANTPKNIGEIYAERAMMSEPDAVMSAANIERTRVSGPLESTGPAIYGGTMPPPSSQDEFARQALLSRNKAVKTRRVSPFNLMLVLIGAAIAIVLYIGNVIAVQQLLKDVSDDQEKLQQILNEQEMLKAQINRMSSLERIRKMAEEDLGLRNPNTAPQWIEIDGEKIRSVEHELSTQQAASRTGK